MFFGFLNLKRLSKLNWIVELEWIGSFPICTLLTLRDLGACLWLKAPDLVKNHWLRMQNATKTLSVSWFQHDSILILLDMYNKDPKINNVYSNNPRSYFRFWASYYNSSAWINLPVEAFPTISVVHQRNMPSACVNQTNSLRSWFVFFPRKKTAHAFL